MDAGYFYAPYIGLDGETIPRRVDQDNFHQDIINERWADMFYEELSESNVNWVEEGF